jgi:uncharacterized protein YprB with RNaseH-like and TPR domain
MYALDIETTGLDCRTDRITSVAVYNPEVSAVFDDSNEERLLGHLHRFIAELDPGQIVTWNGAVFDGPFLATRAETGLRMSGMFPLRKDPSISPKYEPQPGFDPVGYHLAMAATGGHHHTH